jgi:hypothetical protein
MVTVSVVAAGIGGAACSSELTGSIAAGTVAMLENAVERYALETGSAAMPPAVPGSVTARADCAPTVSGRVLLSLHRWHQEDSARCSRCKQGHRDTAATVASRLRLADGPVVLSCVLAECFASNFVFEQ